MKRILLTGANGFVGTSLKDLLGKQQKKVLSISHGNLSKLGTDTLENQIIVEALHDFVPDTFINLAWDVHPANWAFAKSQQPLILTTMLLLDILADMGLEQSIGVGSCLEYKPDSKFMDESHPENRELEYMRDKLAMKQMLTEHAKQNSYLTSWVRFFFLYGLNDRSERLIPSTSKKLKSGLDIELVNPNARVDYLNVADAVEALCVLGETRSGGVFNIGSGQLVTPNEVVTRMIRLAASNSQIIELSKQSQSDMGFVANISKIQELNWAPKVSLDEGLRIFLKSQ